MLNDLVKQAGFENEIGNTEAGSMWVPVIDGQWMGQYRHKVQQDSQGWPISMTLDNRMIADRLVTILIDDDYRSIPAETLTLSYRGQGEIRLEGARIVREIDTGNEYSQFEVIYDGQGYLSLIIEANDPEATGDYIRDISLRRSSQETAGPFNRKYIDFITPFRVIRPLHLIGEQLIYGPGISWEQRKSPEYSHWGGALGAPFEAAAWLANYSDSDLWLNIPVAADDDFVRSLAELMRAELDPDRRLYLELGNELWNWAEPYSFGRDYALTRARSRWQGVEGTVTGYSDGEPVNELMMIYSWQGIRSIEIADIFRDVFASRPDRIISVLAGQIGASMPYWFPSRYLLETPLYTGEEEGMAAGYQADAFAVAPYVGEPEGDYGFRRSGPGDFLDDAIAYVEGRDPYGVQSQEPGMRYQIRSDAALAAEFGLPLLAYEGGQHFTGSRFTRDQVNSHGNMYNLYRSLLKVWEEEGGSLFVHFAGIIPKGKNPPGEEPGYYQSENFGVKEYQNQDLEQAHKMRALLDAMRLSGQIAE